MAAIPVHLSMAALLQLPDHFAQSCHYERLSTEVTDSIWFLCHITSDSANTKAPVVPTATIVNRESRQDD